MAGGHLDSAGQGVIAFSTVLLASWVLERERYPLQLMLLATIICVFLAPETSKTDLHAEDVDLAQK